MITHNNQLGEQPPGRVAQAHQLLGDDLSTPSDGVFGSVQLPRDHRSHRIDSSPGQFLFSLGGLGGEDVVLAAAELFGIFLEASRGSLILAVVAVVASITIVSIIVSCVALSVELPSLPLLYDEAIL